MSVTCLQRRNPPRFSRDSPLPALLIRRLQIIVINITHSACAIKRLNSFSLDNQKEKLHALNQRIGSQTRVYLDKRTYRSTFP